MLSRVCIVFWIVNAGYIYVTKAYYIPCALKGVVSHALESSLTDLLCLAQHCYNKSQFSVIGVSVFQGLSLRAYHQFMT